MTTNAWSDGAKITKYFRIRSTAYVYKHIAWHYILMLLYVARETDTLKNRVYIQGAKVCQSRCVVCPLSLTHNSELDSLCVVGVHCDEIYVPRAYLCLHHYKSHESVMSVLVMLCVEALLTHNTVL